MSTKKSSLVAIFCAAVCLPFVASAAELRVGNDASVSSGEITQGNVYMMGSSVTQGGSIKGDLLSAGGTLQITGAVANDVLGAGGNVSIVSDVGGDVRIAGGNVLIQSKIVGDLAVMGGQITVSGAGIGGDVLIAGGTVTIDAPVIGNVKIAGGQITINSAINGSVEAYAGTVTLGPKAKIAGNLTYQASKEAEIQTGATVTGKIDFTKRESTTTSPAAREALVGTFVTLAFLVKFLMSFVGASAFLYVFPRYAREIIANVSDKPLENLGMGFVTFVVLPAASILLLITVIGIPLGVLGILGYVALVMFASLVAPIVVGSVVHKWIWKPSGYEINWWILLIGVAVYFIVGQIPLFGWIAKFAIMLAMLGAITSVKWRVAKQLR